MHVYYISTLLSRYYHLHQFLINPHWSTTSADLYPLKHNTQALMAQPVKVLSRTHPEPTVCLLQVRDDRGLYNEWRGHAAVPAYPLNDRNRTRVRKKVFQKGLYCLLLVMHNKLIIIIIIIKLLDIIIVKYIVMAIKYKYIKQRNCERLKSCFY